MKIIILIGVCILVLFTACEKQDPLLLCHWTRCEPDYQVTWEELRCDSLPGGKCNCQAITYVLNETLNQYQEHIEYLPGHEEESEIYCN